MILPNKPVRFYLNPPKSVIALTSNGAIEIKDRGLNAVDISANSSPVNFWLDSVGEYPIFWVGPSGTVDYPPTTHTFADQTTTSADTGIIALNSFNSAAHPAFDSSNNGLGTLVMWVWVSEKNVNDVYLVGSSANIFMSLKVNSAGTHWYIPSQYMPGKLRNQGDSQEYPIKQWHCISFTVRRKIPSQSYGTSTTSTTNEEWRSMLLINNETDSSIDSTSLAADAVMRMNNFLNFQGQFINGGFRGLMGYIAAWDTSLTDIELTKLFNSSKSKYMNNPRVGG